MKEPEALIQHVHHVMKAPRIWENVGLEALLFGSQRENLNRGKRQASTRGESRFKHMLQGSIWTKEHTGEA